MTFPIAEWSPDGCRIYNPAGGDLTPYSTPVEALNRAGNPSKVILALGRRVAWLKSVRLPNVAAKEDAHKLLAFRLDDLFPLPASELAYDMMPTEDVNSEGRLWIVGAAKAETLRQAPAVFKESGAKVAGVTLVALGSGQISAAAGGGALYLAHSPEGLSLDVVEGGATVFSRVVPTPENASELQSEVSRTIAASKSKVELVYVDANVGALVDASTNPAPASAISKLTLLPHAMDLRLPEAVAHERTAKATARRRLAILILMATLCVAGLSYLDRDDARLKVEKERDKAKRELDRAKDRLALVTKRLSEIEGTSGLVGDGLEPRQALSDVATIAANAVPEGVWLTGMSLDRGKPLQLRGSAKTNDQVAEYVQSLSTSERLRDVKLVFSNNNTIGDVPIVQFSVSAHVIGNYPLTDTEQKRGSRR